MAVTSVCLLANAVRDPFRPPSLQQQLAERLRTGAQGRQGVHEPTGVEAVLGIAAFAHHFSCHIGPSEALRKAVGVNISSLSDMTRDTIRRHGPIVSHDVPHSTSQIALSFSQTQRTGFQRTGHRPAGIDRRSHCLCPLNVSKVWNGIR